MSWAGLIVEGVRQIGTAVGTELLDAEYRKQIEKLEQIPGLTNTQRQNLMALYAEPLAGAQREAELKGRQELAKRQDISTSDLITREMAMEEARIGGRRGVARDIQAIEAEEMSRKKELKEKLETDKANTLRKNLMNVWVRGAAGAGEAAEIVQESQEADTIANLNKDASIIVGSEMDKYEAIVDAEIEEGAEEDWADLEDADEDEGGE